MKILLILSVITASSCLGYSCGKQYKNKVVFYSDLLLFCACAKNEVSFFKSKLSVILKKAMFDCGKDLAYLCKIAQKSLQDGDFVLLQEKSLLNLRFLTLNERQTIANFFNFLGKSDEKNQKNQIDTYEKIFSDYFEKAKQDCATKGNLYGKLGVYAGLFLAILCL